MFNVGETAEQQPSFPVQTSWPCLSVLFFPSVLQMPKPARAESSCVPTASAWPPSMCATGMMTVEMVVMNSSAPRRWPAGQTICAATPPSVCRWCGPATETQIARIVQTRGRSAAAETGSTRTTAGPTARQRNSAVTTGSVCGSPGSVMEILTARTNLMSLTAVSFSFSLFSYLHSFVFQCSCEHLWLISLITCILFKVSFRTFNRSS